MAFLPEGHGAQNDLEEVASEGTPTTVLNIRIMGLTLGLPVPVINGILLIFEGVKVLAVMLECGRRVYLERSLNMKWRAKCLDL